jgi:hypothetical protein
MHIAKSSNFLLFPANSLTSQIVELNSSTSKLFDRFYSLGILFGGIL